jgi:hypothetical protein
LRRAGRRRGRTELASPGRPIDFQSHRPVPKERWPSLMTSPRRTFHPRRLPRPRQACLRRVKHDDRRNRDLKQLQT